MNEMNFNTISVIGLGYIGLPTAAMFASCQKQVVGVDINESVVNIINQGQIHIVELDLNEMVCKAVTDGYLRASMVAKPADAFLIAVPTPFKKNDSVIPEPDLSYIESAAKSIAPILEKGNLVVLESTSPVGTTEKMADWLAEIRKDLTFPQHAGELADINVAYCPERVLPGHIINELVNNDRVIGGMTTKCSERAIALYKIFVQGECTITNARTAEMSKLAENSCRDVQIAFANELSIVCDKLDIDVWELISLANRHPRVNILQPGPGVGGHCIAVDPWFLVSSSPEHTKHIRTAREINDNKPKWVIQKVMLLAKEHPYKDIICFGLTFKANVDDMRESPALFVFNELKAQLGIRVSGFDPYVPKNEIARININDVHRLDGDSAIVVILVNHSDFNQYSFEGHVVLDFCGLTHE